MKTKSKSVLPLCVKHWIDQRRDSDRAHSLKLSLHGYIEARQNNYIFPAGGQATVLSIALAINNSDVAQYQSFFVMGQGRAREYHRMGAFFIDDVDKYRVKCAFKKKKKSL